MTTHTDTLCGLWVDDDGMAHACYATPEGGRADLNFAQVVFEALAAVVETG